MIRYFGLKPLRFNEPLIELDTIGGESIDLYNDCILDSIRQRAAVLEFSFVRCDDKAIVRLEFYGVSDLRAMQAKDWVPQEWDDIDHLLMRPEGPWPRMEFKAGGFEFQFNCIGIALEVLSVNGGGNS